MIKIIPIISILIFSIMNIYSYTNISTCQTISVPGEYRMNESISNFGGTECINIGPDNVSLDCQGHTIDGVGSGIAIYLGIGGQDYATIKNCKITEVSGGIYSLGADYVKINNITINNASSNGIHLQVIRYSQISNIYVNNSWAAYVVTGPSQYYNITNITGENSDYAIYSTGLSTNVIINNLISSDSNNYGMYSFGFTGGYSNSKIINSNIKAITSPIFMNNVGNFINNEFSNNYIGNFSKIDITGTGISNITFSSNTYLDGTILDPACFIGNSICEIITQIQSPISVSSLPTINTLSIIISIIIIVGFLI
jgi:hypothetical protein